MFEWKKSKLREDLKVVDNLYSELDDKINNRELFNVIEANLHNPIEKGYYIEYASTSEVSLKSRRSNADMFHILITPNVYNIQAIAIKHVYFDGRAEDEIVAQFNRDEKRVIVTKKEIGKTIDPKKSEVVEITNKTTINSYIDDLLRYTYEYKIGTTFRLKNNYSDATLEETFIGVNGSAVKRSAHITEDDFFKDPATITYYETDNYDAPPFENRYQGGTYIVGMNVTTKEVFDAFVSNNNQVLLKK